jgi:hypothetical protein
MCAWPSTTWRGRPGMSAGDAVLVLAPRYVNNDTDCLRKRARVDVEAAGPAGHQTLAMLANWVYCSRNTSRAVPVGPLRCLDTMTSTVPRSGDSGL